MMNIVLEVSLNPLSNPSSSMYSSGGRFLKTHTLIEQEVQLSSSDWTRATELDLLSNQNASLQYSPTPSVPAHVDYA